MDGAPRLAAFVRRRRALGADNFVAVIHAHGAGDLLWAARWLALAASGPGAADGTRDDGMAVIVTDRAPACRGVASVCTLHLGNAALAARTRRVPDPAGSPWTRRRPSLAGLVADVEAACGSGADRPCCIVLDTLATLWLEHALTDVATLVQDVAGGVTGASRRHRTG